MKFVHLHVGHPSIIRARHGVKSKSVNLCKFHPHNIFFKPIIYYLLIFKEGVKMHDAFPH